MTRDEVSSQELLAARRYLADAEQEALDEVVAIRTQAAALLDAAQREAEAVLGAAQEQAEAILAQTSTEISAERTSAMEAVDGARAQLHDYRGQIAAERANLETERANLETERANLETERANLHAERVVIEAMRSEVDAHRRTLEAQRDALSERSQGSAAHAANLLEGTQAEMAELSQLLDQLVDRVADLDGRRANANGGL